MYLYALAVNLKQLDMFDYKVLAKECVSCICESTLIIKYVFLFIDQFSLLVHSTTSFDNNEHIIGQNSNLSCMHKVQYA
jgi:hypothetical protein